MMRRATLRGWARALLRLLGLTTLRACRSERRELETATARLQAQLGRAQAKTSEALALLETERIRIATQHDALRTSREQGDVGVQRLREARAHVRASHARLEAAHVKLRGRRVRLELLTAELDAARGALDRQKSIAAAGHSHLASTLVARAGTPRTRTGTYGDDQLSARSPDYVAAIRAWERGDRPPGSSEALVSGLRLTVPGDSGGSGSLSHRLARGWLPLEDIASVRRFVVGGVMLDIGANVGTTSIPRLILGDFSLVCAAEPNLDNYRCLAGNAIDNGLRGALQPERVAIADVEGTTRLELGTHVGSHYLLPADRVRSQRFEEVSCTTVDAWTARMALAAADIAFVKVDTQGWDARVLAGATALLRARRAVWQVEVSPQMMKRAGSTLSDLAALVRDHFDWVLDLDPQATGPVPSASVGEILHGLSGRRGFTNLLLLNRPPSSHVSS